MWLLDTNVVTEMRKAGLGRGHPAFGRWLESIRFSECHLSVITLFELELATCLLERRNPDHGARLRSSLRTLLERTGLERRIVRIDESIARRCASLHVPTTLPDRDAWIAATALERSLTVVTRNVADFRPAHVPVLNPWEPG